MFLCLLVFLGLFAACVSLPCVVFCLYSVRVVPRYHVVNGASSSDASSISTPSVSAALCLGEPVLLCCLNACWVINGVNQSSYMVVTYLYSVFCVRKDRK